MHRLFLGLISVAIVSSCWPLSAAPAPSDQPGATTATPAGVTPVAPDPNDPNLLLWLDASDRPTLTIGSDGRVSAWSSKAPKVDRKLISSGEQQPRYVVQALGGRPAVQFDGVDDVLRDRAFGQAAQAWTVILVVTPLWGTDEASEPVLHVVAETFVGDELRCLRASGSPFGVPLRGKLG